MGSNAMYLSDLPLANKVMGLPSTFYDGRHLAEPLGGEPIGVAHPL